MSWDIYLREDLGAAQPEGGKTLPVAPHCEGGTYVVGGLATAELNVTYNYSRAFRRGMPGLPEGFRSLHGMRAQDALPHLEHGVRVLGTEPDADYWQPTDGNAGHALQVLAGWARQWPDGRFVVD